MEPAGSTRLGKALVKSGRSVHHLTVEAVDQAAPTPDALRVALSPMTSAPVTLVVAVPPQGPGGASSVDWESHVHGPLRRVFTAVRGLVSAMQEYPRGGSVIMAMPLTALFADQARMGDSVLGRSLVGLAEGLRAELLHTGVPVTILLTESAEDEGTLAHRIDDVIESGPLYALPASISRSDISDVFDTWLGALAETPSDLALPEMGPMGGVYRAEIQRHDHVQSQRGVTNDHAYGGRTGSSISVASSGGIAALTNSVLTAGRTAVVTGGASGIGLGIVQAILERGMNVVIADVREDHIAQALARVDQHKDRVMALRLDVADRAAWRRAATDTYARFGAIDVLCLNAGIGVLGRILQSTPADWSWLMGVNLSGVTNGIEVVLPFMRAQRDGGWVIATSSAGGLMVANDGGIYSAAKFGVVAAMDCLRAELATEGMGVTTLCPAGVNTNIHDHETMRPEEFSDSGVRGSDAELDEQQTRARAMLARATDPMRVGLRVRQAVDENVPVVFTDGGIAPIVRLRRDAIMSAIASGDDWHEPRAASTRPRSRPR